MNKKTVFAASMMVFTILLMLVVNEAFLRWYFLGSLTRVSNPESSMIPHPTRGFSLKPGSKSWHQELDFTVEVNVNSQGLRGPEVQPKGSKQRILIIGDSTTFGSGVPEDRIIPTLLAQKLDGYQVDVVNGSFTTYNTVQELLFLEEEGLSFKPDLVILAFSPNTDIQVNTLALQTLHQKHKKHPYATLTPEGRLQLDLTYVEKAYREQQEQPQAPKTSPFWKEQVTYRLIKKYIRGFKSSKWNDPNIFIGWPFLSEFSPEHSTRGMAADEYQTLWEEGWNVTKALILRMQEDSRKHGARFAMMVMAPKLQVEAVYQSRVLEAFPYLKLDTTRINRVFEDFGRKAGIPVLDALSPLLEAEARGEEGLYYNVEDEHMTAKSHEYVASALANQIREQGLLE
ncbi:MAG: hypothetical protein KC592_04245 [Nitrospira sp.]|nr:hypothetical protein [Nitrospira sp.]HBP89270.1 hypothetical protein [Nitrospiraceae bacterium]HNP28141.1 hypothetical protein [Nitrospirales bacterium]